MNPQKTIKWVTIAEDTWHGIVAPIIAPITCLWIWGVGGGVLGFLCVLTWYVAASYRLHKKAVETAAMLLLRSEK